MRPVRLLTTLSSSLNIIHSTLNTSARRRVHTEAQAHICIHTVEKMVDSWKDTGGNLIAFWSLDRM